MAEGVSIGFGVPDDTTAAPTQRAGSHDQAPGSTAAPDPTPDTSPAPAPAPGVELAPVTTPVAETGEPEPENPDSSQPGSVGGRIADRTGEALERAKSTSGRIASALVDRLRNDAEFEVDRGTTRIDDEVVEKIAGIAARDVAGVHDLGGDAARFFSAVRERVGLGEERGKRGVSVRLDGDEARINVSLVVEYGVRVHPVTVAVRAAIITAVQEMLDLNVVEVDIVVNDVHVPDGSA